MLRRAVANMFSELTCFVCVVSVMFPTHLSLVSLVNVVLDSPTVLTLWSFSGIIRKSFFVCYDFHVSAGLILVSVVIDSPTFFTLLGFAGIIGKNVLVCYDIYVPNGLTLVSVVIDSLTLLRFSSIINTNLFVCLLFVGYDVRFPT